MKNRLSCHDLKPLIALCVAFLLILLCEKNRAADPIAEAFITPEQIMKFHEQIGLTESQGEKLKVAFEETQQRIQGLQGTMQEESKKLAELANAGNVDEKAVSAQADKILDIEREMKHAQISLLVLIKNTLTPEQQREVRELKGSTVSLESKMAEVKLAAQRWQQEGRDLAPVMSLKGELESLMAEGKSQEAIAVLDKALKILNGEAVK